jgi:pimeloyl-ACP methyl ester carboxylesterase
LAELLVWRIFMPKVKIGDINMYYEVHGRGEPLVMIAGAGASVKWMYHVIPIYSKDYQFILYDNRDIGKTEGPDTPYTIEMLADDLAGLLNAIGIKAAHVHGTSMGGMIAQQLAIRHSEKVISLILKSTYCGGPGSAFHEDHLKYLKQRKNMTREEYIRKTFRISITRQFAEKNPEAMKQFMELAKDFPSPAILDKQNETVMKHNTYEQLPKIKAPTLVIHGNDDHIFPAINARIIASRIPHAEVKIFEDAGHIMIEAGIEPEVAALDFFKRHSKTGKGK